MNGWHFNACQDELICWTGSKGGWEPMQLNQEESPASASPDRWASLQPGSEERPPTDLAWRDRRGISPLISGGNNFPA